MSGRDPLGYYGVLNISPGAPLEEIELAYRFLKKSYQDRQQAVNVGKIQAAYETLRDRKRRIAYDQKRHQTLGRRATRLGRHGLLGLLLVLLAVVVVFIHGPTWKANLTHYEPGDLLYLRETGSVFGTVLEFDGEHLFFNGVQAPAYLIEPSGGSDSVWYPARDLTRVCRE